MISTLLLRVSVVLGLIGMTLGMVMGIRKDFTLAPAHAHLNLVGFVVPFLAGLYYRAVPRAGASVLARYHAWIAILGAIVFPDRYCRGAAERIRGVGSIGRRHRA